MTAAIRMCPWALMARLVLTCFTADACAAANGPTVRTLRVALVQFDAVPEQPERNLREMERLARQAVGQGARLVMFHEGTLTDYTPKLNELAEQVPDGPACQEIASLASSFTATSASACPSGTATASTSPRSSSARKGWSTATARLGSGARRKTRDTATSTLGTIPDPALSDSRSTASSLLASSVPMGKHLVASSGPRHCDRSWSSIPTIVAGCPLFPSSALGRRRLLHRCLSPTAWARAGCTTARAAVWRLTRRETCCRRRIGRAEKKCSWLT